MSGRNDDATVAAMLGAPESSLDTPMDVTPEERVRVEARHLDLAAIKAALAVSPRLPPSPEQVEWLVARVEALEARAEDSRAECEHLRRLLTEAVQIELAVRPNSLLWPRWAADYADIVQAWLRETEQTLARAT